MAGAAPERRLIDRGGEAARRHPGEHACETRPGHVVELARRPRHAGDLDMAPKARKRPVERAYQPRLGVLARERCAAPFVRAVEEPDAGKAERSNDRRDLWHV